MSYKKGYPYKTYPANIPADWDWVWHVGAMGGQYDGAYDPYLLERWNATDRFKRGLILIPAKTAKDTVNENASFHLQLIQEKFSDLKISGAPIIIDYLGAASGRYTYDDLVAYVAYIGANWKIDGAPIPNKILLRANLATWNIWMKEPNTANMLKVVEPLVVRWDATKPEELTYYGAVQWWEYRYKVITEMGLIAYDETGLWTRSPNEIVVPYIPEPEPEPEPESEGDLIECELERFTPCKYKVTAEINIFGFKFPITGIAEALDDTGD